MWSVGSGIKCCVKSHDVVEKLQYITTNLHVFARSSFRNSIVPVLNLLKWELSITPLTHYLIASKQNNFFFLGKILYEKIFVAGKVDRSKPTKIIWNDYRRVFETNRRTTEWREVNNPAAECVFLIWPSTRSIFLEPGLCSKTALFMCMTGKRK